MNKEFKKEIDLSPKTPEDQKFIELKNAMNEQALLMEEIIIARGTETEESVRERIVPLLDEASKKTVEAMQAWLETRRNLTGPGREKLDDSKEVEKNIS